MPEIFDKFSTYSLIISGFFITLVGFNVIKLKGTEKFLSNKKFRIFSKIFGIITLLYGILLVATVNSNSTQEWTQEQKEQMKKEILANSQYFQSMNPDTADMILTCFVDKYTEKYTLEDAKEQEKMSESEIEKIVRPIFLECFKKYLPEQFNNLQEQEEQQDQTNN